MTANLLPQYHQLLYEAKACSSAVEMFDLDGRDAGNVERWNEIKRQCRVANFLLIGFIVANEATLVSQLEAVSQPLPIPADPDDYMDDERE